MLAIAEQAARLDHVLFAGCTHPPGVEVAERLARIPEGSFVAMKKLMRRPVLERIERYRSDHDPVAAELWASPEVRGSIEGFLAATVGKGAGRS